MEQRRWLLTALLTFFRCCHLFVPLFVPLGPPSFSLASFLEVLKVLKGSSILQALLGSGSRSRDTVLSAHKCRWREATEIGDGVRRRPAATDTELVYFGMAPGRTLEIRICPPSLTCSKILLYSCLAVLISQLFSCQNVAFHVMFVATLCLDSIMECYSYSLNCRCDSFLHPFKRPTLPTALRMSSNSFIHISG
jgi:hypothetical protein